MLISYALFIFALASSVVAPPPPRQQIEWQALKGATDPRLIDNLWYKVELLAPGEQLPSWPDVKILDHVLELVPARDGRIEAICIYQFGRKFVDNDGQYELHRIVPEELDRVPLWKEQALLQGWWATKVSDKFQKS